MTSASPPPPRPWPGAWPLPARGPAAPKPSANQRGGGRASGLPAEALAADHRRPEAALSPLLEGSGRPTCCRQTPRADSRSSASCRAIAIFRRRRPAGQGPWRIPEVQGRPRAARCPRGLSALQRVSGGESLTRGGRRRRGKWEGLRASAAPSVVTLSAPSFLPFESFCAIPSARTFCALPAPLTTVSTAGSGFQRSEAPFGLRLRLE